MQTQKKTLISPPIAKLIEEKGWESPTPMQLEAYKHISQGDNTLIIAPTGSGKTEAALLPILDQMLAMNARPVSVVYITPLKALINDLYKRISWWAERLGFIVSRKHGDVSKGERARRTRKIPHIMILTPESLKIDLDWSSGFRVNYKNVRWVIIDEVHELIGTKRGVQLSVLLERLKRLADRDIQRIALSATIGDPKLVARFIFGGSKRPQAIVMPDTKKRVSMKIRYAGPVNGDGVDLWENSARILAEEIGEGPTIVFVDSRFLAERLQETLANQGVDRVYVHHSSVSAELKSEIEERFRKGEVRAIIATKTLELGIDIGEIKKIIQFKGPVRVSNLLQRVGRSGHRLGAESRGVIVAVDPIDFLTSLAVSRLAVEGIVEPPDTGHVPLDVIAREVVGMALAEGEIKPEEIYKTIASSTPGSTLEKPYFDKLIDYLITNRLLVRRGEKVKVGPSFYKIWRFRRTDAPPWARSFSDFFTVIPKTENFTVVYRDKAIGTIDFNYVYRHLREGDIIRLAGGLWQIKSINEQTRTIKIVKSRSKEGEIPIWRGETFQRSPLVAHETYKVLASAVNGDNIEHPLLEIDPRGIEALSEITIFYKKTDAPIPSTIKVVVENEGDETLLLYPFGTRLAETIGAILTFLISKRHGLNTYYRASALGVSIKAPSNTDPAQLLEELAKNDEDNVRAMLWRAVTRTPQFKQVMNEVKSSFGVIMKADPEEDQLLIEEVARQVMSRNLDPEGLIEFLKKIREREIVLERFESPYVSPIAAYILSLPAVKPWTKKVERAIAEALDLSEKTVGNALREMRKPGNPYRMFCFYDILDRECRWALLDDVEDIIRMEEFAESFKPLRDESVQVMALTTRGGLPITFMAGPTSLGRLQEKMNMLPKEIYKLIIKSLNYYDERQVSYFHVPRELLPILIMNSISFLQRTRYY
ncbi:MAG: DEAD/DEAH box helicase [Desulfurococcales archaeon]|nr:DEAD/DEAH box helicase [Desulfurococcales archaeon]